MKKTIALSTAALLAMTTTVFAGAHNQVSTNEQGSANASENSANGLPGGSNGAMAGIEADGTNSQGKATSATKKNGG